LAQRELSYEAVFTGVLATRYTTDLDSLGQTLAAMDVTDRLLAGGMSEQELSPLCASRLVAAAT
jgi:hypothetical protein